MTSVNYHKHEQLIPTGNLRAQMKRAEQQK